MLFIARAPHYRRAERLLRAVWRVSRVVGGIRADTVSDDERLHVDRRGLSEIERSPFRVIGRLCVPSLGRHTIVARNVCYVRCGVSPVSSAASGLTLFPTCSSMSIDAGCEGSRVGRTALLLHTPSAFVVLTCRGARTCVSGFYPHTQPVRVKLLHHQ
jgi:hypothetical protein